MVGKNINASTLSRRKETEVSTLYTHATLHKLTADNVLWGHGRVNGSTWFQENRPSHMKGGMFSTHTFC